MSLPIHRVRCKATGLVKHVRLLKDVEGIYQKIFLPS